MQGICKLTCMNILSASPMLPFSFKMIPCRRLGEIKLELLGYGRPVCIPIIKLIWIKAQAACLRLAHELNIWKK